MGGEEASPRKGEDEVNANLSDAALNLFLRLARDAGNWGGTPLFDETSNAAKGYLTALKTQELLTTFEDNDGQVPCVFVQFTEAGQALAAEHGINLS